MTLPTPTFISRIGWTLALRGIFALIAGILALVLPSMTLQVLVLVFGAYAFADGVVALASALMGRIDTQSTWALLLEGIAGIGVALISLLWPGITATAFLYLIAAWALVTGVFEIVTAVRFRKVIEGEWVLALSGILSVLFGVALFYNPAAGALAVTWLIGMYLIVFGVLLIVLAFNLRSWVRGILGPKA